MAAAPALVPALSGDSASESSGEKAELHADVIDAAPSALTDDAGSQPPDQYVLRNRRVLPAHLPPVMTSTSPVVLKRPSRRAYSSTPAARKRTFNKRLIRYFKQYFMCVRKPEASCVFVFGNTD